MLAQEIRDVEPLFVLDVLGDHRLPGIKREPSRGPAAGVYHQVADQSRLPSRTRPHQELVAAGQRFHHLGPVDVQTLGRQHDGFVQQGVQVVHHQRLAAEFGQRALPADPSFAVEGVGVISHGKDNTRSARLVTKITTRIS